MDKCQNLWLAYSIIEPFNSLITKIKLANSVELTNHHQ